MSIKLDCPQCSRAYTLKDELAGKKFRCKDCQSVVSVPAAEEVLVAAVVEDEDPFAQDEDFEPAPRRERSAPKKKGKKKKKSDGAGTAAIKTLVTIGLVVFGLVVLGGVVGGVIYTGIQISKQVKLATEWVDFTMPGGAFSVKMPEKPTTNFPGAERLVSPGSTTYASSHAKQHYIVGSMPLTAEAQQLNDEEYYSSGLKNLRQSGQYEAEQTTLAGRRAIRFEAEEKTPSGNAKVVTYLIRASNRGYIFVYSSEGSINPANRDRFFNSVQFHR